MEFACVTVNLFMFQVEQFYQPVLIDVHLQLCNFRSHTTLFLTHPLKCCHHLAQKTQKNTLSDVVYRNTYVQLT